MKYLLCTAALLAMAAARPEMYKENEDFQFSRSSSDEGQKSGFYGAQRGNMGGNYEKAHNMDTLAQHQMNGAVKQIEGELGEGSNTRSGSVFTAANSRGVYGSGRYDLSGLQGRNFQEGVSFDHSQSQSALTSHNSAYTGYSSSATQNSGYSNSHLQDSSYAGYQGTQNTGHALQSGSLQAAENTGNTGAYGYGRQNGYQSSYQSSHQAGYASQSGYRNQNGYDNISMYPTNTQSHLVYATPVRVVGRPGARIAIPIGVQTYDATHSASLVDQNAINSEAEVLNNADRQNTNINYQPNTNGKHYESSYSYRKQWERHDTKPEIIPLPVPTANPYPQNSELYDDTQTLLSSGSQQTKGLESHSAHSINSAYNANLNSASSASRYQSGYNAQRNMASIDANSNAYTHGAHNFGAAAGANVLGESDSKPKSYQSSYSYHKSWERQGDPYVIKPVGGVYTDQASQRLTDTNNHAYSTYHSGSQYGQLQRHHHGSGLDCDENGHIRVARSYNRNDYQQREDLSQQSQNLEDLGQQSQNLEDFGQQSQNMENLGQQSQKLEDLGQQSQNLEDFGQQSQNLENLGQKSQNLEDLGQQSQNLEDFGQQSENLEDFGQQSQNLENLGQQSQNLEDLGQQSQNFEDFGQQSQNLEDFGQQSQNLENLGQQSQNLEDLGQQSQNLEDFGQQSQNLEDFVQQSQKLNSWDNIRDLRQQTQDDWNKGVEKKIEDFGQQTQTELGQQTQDSRNKLDNLGKPEKLEDLGQQSQNVWELEDLGQQVQQVSEDSQLNQIRQNISQENESNTFGEQENQSNYDVLHGFNQYSQNTEKESKIDSQTNNNHYNIWEHIDSLQKYPNFESSQIPSEIGKENFRNVEQQNNKVNQISQTTNENLGQQIQSSYGNLEILNKYKRNSTSYETKPIWEQSEDDTQQTSQSINAEEFGIHTKPDSFSNNPWGFAYNRHLTNNLSDQTQSDHSNNYWNMKEYKENSANNNFYFNHNAIGGSSLHSLWDKINNLDQESSFSTNRDRSDNDNFFSNGNTNSQTFHQSTSQQTSYQFENSSSFSENTHYEGQYVGHPWIANAPAYNPWQSHVPTENMTPSTTVQVTSSTVKPKEENSYNSNSRPMDIGRGDIGPEESILVTPTTEKANSVVQTKPGSAISSFHNYNKQFKTPGEIEALSLTSETNTQNHETTVDKNNQQIDKTLSVLSNAYVPSWRDIQEEHGPKHYSNIDFPSMLLSSSSPKSNSASHITHTIDEQRQSDQIHSYSKFERVESNINKYGVTHYPVLDSYNNRDTNKYDLQDNINAEENTDQKFENLDQFKQQRSENLDQQSQSNWGQNLDNFGEYNHNLDQQIQTNGEQHLQDFGQQQRVNLEEQSERAIVHEVQDFGQQEQTVWNPNENLQQQAETQKFENMGQSNQYQKQDFYNQRYAFQSQQEQKPEDLQTPPEFSKKVENIQSTQQQNEDVEVIKPVEPTEKPGFWKSVGSKFTSAKDRVASWFKKS